MWILKQRPTSKKVKKKVNFRVIFPYFIHMYVYLNSNVQFINSLYKLTNQKLMLCHEKNLYISVLDDEWIYLRFFFIPNE
jgi:hypothetical protein